MKAYYLKHSKVRKFADNHTELWAVYDKVGEGKNDHQTIITDGADCAISAQDKTVRADIKEWIAMLDILDRHYDVVSEMLRTYADYYRGELNNET